MQANQIEPISQQISSKNLEPIWNCAPVNSRMIVQPCERQHQPLFLKRKTGSFTKEKSKGNF